MIDMPCECGYHGDEVDDGPSIPTWCYLLIMLLMQSLILVKIIRLASSAANPFTAEVIVGVHCATRTALTANVAAEPQIGSVADEVVTKTEQERDYDVTDGVSEKDLTEESALQMRAGSTDDKKALARRARRKA